MKMLEIAALENGAHRNQDYHGFLPDGWAVIPEDMEPENFPFGKVTAEEVTCYREVEVLRDVVKEREVEKFREVAKTHEVPAMGEDGNPVMDEDGKPVLVTEEYTDMEPYMDTEEYTEQELTVEQVPYSVMTLTDWEPLPMPEPEPENEPAPSQLDMIEAQVTYTAMMTDTLLEV